MPASPSTVDLAVFASQASINPGTERVGAVIASSATVTLVKPVHHISGTESITTLIPPFTGFVGRVSLIADGAFTMTTGGTSPYAIGTVVTAVASQVLDMTYDGVTWYPHIAD